MRWLTGPKTDYYRRDNSYDLKGQIKNWTIDQKYNGSTFIKRMGEIISVTYAGNILQQKIERQIFQPPGMDPIISFAKTTNTIDSVSRIIFSEFSTSSDSLNYNLDSVFAISYNAANQPTNVTKTTATSTVSFSEIVWEDWCAGFTNTNGLQFTYPCGECRPQIREMALRSWDTITNDFIPVYRKVFTTGAQNELIYTTETYNKHTAKWSMYERTTRLLNSSGDLSKVIYESAHLPTFTDFFVYINGRLAEKYETNAAGDTIFRVHYFPGYVSGIKEQPQNATLSIWPNPATDLLNISYPFSQPGTLRLYDLHGRLLMEGRLDQQVTTFDVSHLPRSVLFVVITDPDNIRITKNIVLGVTQ